MAALCDASESVCCARMTSTRRGFDVFGAVVAGTALVGGVGRCLRCGASWFSFKEGCNRSVCVFPLDLLFV